jgi:NADH-quinone oxidoreductase subunit D
MYAFREREKLLDLFEAISGARMMCNFMRFGGLRCDTPAGWLDRVRKLVAEFPRFLDEFDELISSNEILIARTHDIGAISAEDAIAFSMSGPILRATGVNYDIRKVDGYGLYPQLKFRVPLGEKGDCYDRMMMRFLEMRESLAILDQVLEEVPEGPVVNPKVNARSFKPPVGEAYGRIEAPKGELGFYLISDRKTEPYRYRVRPPSFINLTALEELCVGHVIADVMVILGTIDIVLGEVDR